ncbi:MAG: hypothetical protein QGF21_08870 [Vicinamibacterales bacterium]|jgi:hypothetical protein|nr:hypothetical protein [Acidobacteriota bacterium]MDP7472075.1 hypothetical protein [Vicinamibacterales bacterium]MDP7672043.1 hypothetical protein [Vicinamibacterales bacterium]HJO39202.1 hypothetical protein [Vicinamibacterales bacterium]|tara:strand:+ start:2113 stop:2601 length:489 start_codon:yes stop_codon:yes gene_type:complete
MRAAAVGALIALAGPWLAPTLAQAQAGKHDSLAESGPVGSIVAPMDLDAVQDGLTTDALQQVVADRLDAQAVPVDRGAGPPPHLEVSVNTVKGDSGVYGYSIDLKLSQIVTVRATGRETIAATWGFGIVGTIPAAQLPTVVEQVARAVDQFSADYLAVNPAP